jgi:predicted Ser/Thr protein kinase
VDFETSSNTRKPANVTAICQYLIMSGGPVARGISEILGERNRDEVIAALRSYKQDQTHENLDEVMLACLH